MACARLAAAFAAAVAVALPVASAHAASSPPAAPQNLHAFGLRANEAVAHTFARTPTFGWSPVAGAKSYEFELSTSKRFADNGIVWSSKTIKSPGAALPLTLPWITGSPYSLYAHVRAITAKGVSPWSAPFGFNMRWPAVPTPLSPSYPGLLRWSSVPGASGYMVWLMDAGHWFTTRTNMADEREYYDFHNAASWTGTVHWRVRPMRWLYGNTDNGLPSVSYGPWSPVYTSVNPPFNVGPLGSLATVSNAGLGDASNFVTHNITPAFLYSGNTSIFGTASELYHVMVFTDEDCLNPVFKGAMVGSPAYVPREIGPLALPVDVNGLTNARGVYLKFGDEPEWKTAEGFVAKTNEMDKASAADDGHTGLPPSQVVAPAKVDLWDSDWDGGRYYWTVVPVDAIPASQVNTTLTAPTAPGDTTFDVVDATGINAGDTVRIGVPAELGTVAAVAGNTITVTLPLGGAHAAGDTVIRPAGAVTYVDDELTQDSCASGREGAFAKTSDPVVTTQSNTPFASGLSPSGGQLVAASSQAPRFYGFPLVAWQPVVSAGQYEVQWSKKLYPWATAGSQLTYGTSLTLPVAPGTWYYRVRGLDFLMTGTKPQMSWSDPARVVITKPRFKVVH
jgi:hypothetical protein